jgi:predicted SnoaL-like aldol condensation-catalyzing enzyme
MSVRESIVIAHQWIEEIWNRGRVSLINEMHSETYTHHNLHSHKPGGESCDSIIKWITEFRDSYPHHRINIESLVAAKNVVTVHWKAADPAGSSDSGRELFGHLILTIENQQIVETRLFTVSPLSKM